MGSHVVYVAMHWILDVVAPLALEKCASEGMPPPPPTTTSMGYMRAQYPLLRGLSMT